MHKGRDGPTPPLDPPLKSALRSEESLAEIAPLVNPNVQTTPIFCGTIYVEVCSRAVLIFITAVISDSLSHFRNQETTKTV